MRSRRQASAALIASALVVASLPAYAGKVPIPREKPARTTHQAPAVVPAPPELAKSLPRSIVSLAVVPKNEYDACLEELAGSGATFVKSFHVSEQGCTLSGAVTLLAVKTADGDVRLPGRPKLLCPFALKFAGWLTEVGAPIISQRLGTSLTAIQTGSGFVCRNRVGGGGSKISEHARGNALDLMRFELRNTRRLDVETMVAKSSTEVLSGLRRSACGYFTTVLGPGSNAAHANHLHFDLGHHGKSGKYRICE